MSSCTALVFAYSAREPDKPWTRPCSRWRALETPTTHLTFLFPPSRLMQDVLIYDERGRFDRVGCHVVPSSPAIRAFLVRRDAPLLSSRSPCVSTRSGVAFPVPKNSRKRPYECRTRSSFRRAVIFVFQRIRPRQVRLSRCDQPGFRKKPLYSNVIVLFRELGEPRSPKG